MTSPASETVEVGVRERVLRALDAVIDPELDEPITTLRFVSSVSVGDAGEVEVGLRLPTPQCAPNFAFLMAADARAAVRRLPGVSSVTVTLEDHYTADEINAALGRDEGFTSAFPGETEDDELAALRELFTRKALTARQSRLCEGFLRVGASAQEIVAMTVRDLPAGAARCLELRSQLGIATGADAPAFVTADGRPLTADQLDRWLRMARLIRTSLEANGGICRSLLQVRHGLPSERKEIAR